jgi:hypothetical protein
VHLQLTCLLGELGLDIQEAHAFSTIDGYSLDVFVVTGWRLGVCNSYLSSISEIVLFPLCYCNQLLVLVSILVLIFHTDMVSHFQGTKQLQEKLLEKFRSIEVHDSLWSCEVGNFQLYEMQSHAWFQDNCQFTRI